jgi:PAS domain S-box-containing protein
METSEQKETYLATLNLLEDITRENEARKKSEEALRDSEEKYRMLVNTANESVIVVQDSRFKFINPETLRLLQGYSEKELMERPYLDFIHPADRSKVIENHRRRIANESISTRYTFRVVTRDSIVKWVEISVALIEWEGKPATLNFLTDITERKQAEQFLKESQEQLRVFAGHLHSVREEERVGIARELHDNLGQNLSAIKMDICMLIKKLDDLKGIKSIAAIIEQARTTIPMIEMTIDQVRKISGELRPHLLEELGLIAAIERHVEDFGRRSGISCQLISQVRKINVQRKYAVGIFRILQEALTNVMRHANASSVFVRILKSKGAIVMEIEDNGIGIKATRINNIKSIGILGMRERAMLIGGELMITTRKGKGTKITLIIPVKKSRR